MYHTEQSEIAGSRLILFAGLFNIKTLYKAIVAYNHYYRSTLAFSIKL